MSEIGALNLEISEKMSENWCFGMTYEETITTLPLWGDAVALTANIGKGPAAGRWVWCRSDTQDDCHERRAHSVVTCSDKILNRAGGRGLDEV